MQKPSTFNVQCKNLVSHWNLLGFRIVNWVARFFYFKVPKKDVVTRNWYFKIVFFRLFSDQNTILMCENDVEKPSEFKNIIISNLKKIDLLGFCFARQYSGLFIFSLLPIGIQLFLRSSTSDTFSISFGQQALHPLDFLHVMDLLLHFLMFHWISY